MNNHSLEFEEYLASVWIAESHLPYSAQDFQQQHSVSSEANSPKKMDGLDNARITWMLICLQHNQYTLMLPL